MRACLLCEEEEEEGDLYYFGGRKGEVEMIQRKDGVLMDEGVLIFKVLPPRWIWLQ